MLEQQHFENSAKIKIKFLFLSLFFILTFQLPCKSKNAFVFEPHCTSSKTITQYDSTYNRIIFIENMTIEVYYNDTNDSVDIQIDVLNSNDLPLLIGINSISTLVGDTFIIQSILPDINLSESIGLINLEQDHTISIIEHRFKKLKNYTFVFYIVNDWNKFSNCVIDKTKVTTYSNEIGQDVIEIQNDKVPDEGITIITLSGISFSDKLKKLSYQINKY